VVARWNLSPGQSHSVRCECRKGAKHSPETLGSQLPIMWDHGPDVEGVPVVAKHCIGVTWADVAVQPAGRDTIFEARFSAITRGVRHVRHWRELALRARRWQASGLSAPGMLN
jgi:hypothetical protein